MLTFTSVHFDNRIPNWRNTLTVLDHNVIALILDGKVKYTLNDHPVIAEKGDLLIIPIGTMRASENMEGEHQKMTVLFQHSKADTEVLPVLGSARFSKCKIRNFEYMKQRFERLYLEALSKGKGKFNPYVITGILLELVGMAAREFEQVEVTPIKLKLANEIQNYLVSHYREPTHIDQLAALIHRSANYTISIFREVTGVSPIQYVHSLRMKEACNLLTNSDLSVTEISNYLGYYDHSYFFRIFKKFTSLSPTEYKHSESL
ncbi:helix-turn-helix domain-containing protein [Paenibacillus sp. OV219]|uniref:helix-turn-helix domain-containing protein n=1 Tax=Paenibacillus sp. OV219 TaxID=1884377 RepID=UPI0008ABBBE6|nr:helix-turn-helix domain-containing protein [Paenibacillus sp. OV219]SEN05232.1 AraC family transcriptional regulator, arabinose operon regulatory protein [Paenibacillus sp. OV219]